MANKFSEVDDKVNPQNEPFELVSLNDFASAKHINNSHEHGSQGKAAQVFGEIDFFDSKEDLTISTHSDRSNKRYTQTELSNMDSDSLTYSPSGRSVVKVNGESILNEQEEVKHKYTREEISKIDPERLTYSPSGRSIVAIDGKPI